jgi:hypothetical protein
MRQGIVVLGFVIIVLMVIAGCTSPQNGTSTGTRHQKFANGVSAPSASTAPTTFHTQSVPQDINAIQAFSIEKTSLTMSIDRITVRPNRVYPTTHSDFTVNYTITNTGTEALALEVICAKIMTEQPNEKIFCTVNEPQCNSTNMCIGFMDGNYVSYPGIPRKGYSTIYLEKKEYAALERGSVISLSMIMDYGEDKGTDRYHGYYTDTDTRFVFPVWKVNWAKDVTILPAISK